MSYIADTVEPKHYKSLHNLSFFDIEVRRESSEIMEIGGLSAAGRKFCSRSLTDFVHFIKGSDFVCGHNVFLHDLKFLKKELQDAGIKENQIIDTLYLSPLLYPNKPYHALVKDYKLQSEELNNPVNDCLLTQELLHDEVEAFRALEPALKQIYSGLLFHKKEFHAFFRHANHKPEAVDLQNIIRTLFKKLICEKIDLDSIIKHYPVELAFALALIQTRDRYSISPPWVLVNYPHVERLMYLLCNHPCLEGCAYCHQALDAVVGLNRHFGFDSYRKFAGEPLQEEAVKATLKNKSILAVFPTGGGKSITFQVPALMSGENARALTVVISPLQSLMKDQVDNLEKHGITNAVTINGLLDPIERSQSFNRVEDGSASLLYISPESLRSPSVERLLGKRKIARFVIDEAHCFSSWGQDFRVDYLYIGDFIRNLQERKNLDEPIPVSCFTATAKQKVILDICQYFYEKLSLELEIFSSKAGRTNLQYRVLEKGNETEKYQHLRALLEEKECPTIIYVSRTRAAYSLAQRLCSDGFPTKPYHGKMDKQEKSENQNAFMAGDVPIMVATSAFGMGVDKKDVGRVIHYEISDSLENYIQEAGRAGRDENIDAECYVLFNEEDLSKHFILLNQTKLSIKEIGQVWRAIKGVTQFRSKVSNSALEIARKAGWDENIADIETRVTTAIAALEESGYVKRGQNMPRIFANSILTKNAQEAIDKINASFRFNDKQKVQATRIIRKLFSSRSRKKAQDEEAETRVDHISDHLGIVKEEVICIINLLKEEQILADTKDLTAFIRKGENKNRSKIILETYCKIEDILLPLFEEEEKLFNLKEINEKCQLSGITDCSPNKIKNIINFWSIKNWIKKHAPGQSKSHLTIKRIEPFSSLKEKLENRHAGANFILDFLFEKSRFNLPENKNKDEVWVEFSVHQLKEEYDKANQMFKVHMSIQDVEDILFFLSRIEALKIEGGFLVVYNKLSIERLEKDNRIKYKAEDYEKLNAFYENKVQQIHIVGEYAKRMITDYQDALQFVDDYFQMSYPAFLNKYFKGSRKSDISRNITPTKFNQLFGELSPAQLQIIKDNDSRNIVVAAGPGSGKTRVLVHKLASLLLMEDVKHDQLLMLTFSRAAATEFKKRLIGLIGGAARFIEIKTFHSYCFDLLGTMGDLAKADTVLQQAVDKIRSGEVEHNRITKTVLVIDEAQDMDAKEFELIRCLMEINEEMRVIAVGDDDQNIYEFRGSDSKFMEELILKHNAGKYELVENYRSKANLVDFTNQFAQGISQRLKKTPVMAKQTDDGFIRLAQYRGGNLIEPLVNDVLERGTSGSICVLTQSNYEAMQIKGLLLKNQIPAKLIQSHEGFDLINLFELRYFLGLILNKEVIHIISKERWDWAKREWEKRFIKSEKRELCLNIFHDFEIINPKIKYYSDLEMYLRESKPEDFTPTKAETVIVSTMHKAKGKEFDHVFIMLDNFNAYPDEKKRQLYVAMTRAKEKLSIHLTKNCLSHISTAGLETVNNQDTYAYPSNLILQAGMKDVWLDYFAGSQSIIQHMNSGEVLQIKETGGHDSQGRCLLKFSRNFSKTLEDLRNKGYQPEKAKVNYMVVWKGESAEKEIIVLLPEISLRKTL